MSVELGCPPCNLVILCDHPQGTMEKNSETATLERCEGRLGHDDRLSESSRQTACALDGLRFARPPRSERGAVSAARKTKAAANESAIGSHLDDRRRSACGAPIPTFGVELDELERDLKDDDFDERRSQRLRKERRWQHRKLSEIRESAESMPKNIGKLTADVAELFGSDEENDDVLSFDFRCKQLTWTTKSESAKAANPEYSHPADCQENEELGDELPGNDHTDCDPASALPLNESTNSPGEADAVQSQVEQLEKERSSEENDHHNNRFRDEGLERTRSGTEPSSDKAVTTSENHSLSQALEEILLESDVASFTLRQVKQQLNTRFGIKVGKHNRELVKSRLIRFVQITDNKVRNSNRQRVGEVAQLEAATATSVDSRPAIEDVTNECTAKDQQSSSGASVVATAASSGFDKDKKLKRRVDVLSVSKLSGRHDESDHVIMSGNNPEASIGSSGTLKDHLKHKLSELTQTEPNAPSLHSSEAEVTHPPTASLEPPRKRRGRPPKETIELKGSTDGSGAYFVAPRRVKRVFTAENPAVPPESAVTREPKRKKPHSQCSLCRTCPCQQPTAHTSIALLNPGQSDGAIEKALMRRLQHLEQSADRYDEQAEGMRRKLKKHRRDMWRKLEASSEDDSLQRSRVYQFLPDVEEMDRNSSALSVSHRLDSSTVNRAKSRMFSFAATYQPTLTQMFGCPSKKANSVESGEDGPFNLETVSEETPARLMEDECSILPRSEDEADDTLAHSQLSNPTLDVQRIEIRDGLDAADALTRIWGHYSSAGGSKSLWDRIFDEPAEAGDFNLEQLESMLDQFKSPGTPTRQTSPVRLSMLTQRGRLRADEIFVRICSDRDRLARLDSICPKWQENVLFALCQDDVDDVQDALEGVTLAQAKLNRLKVAMMRTIDAQEEVLGVFHEALSESIARFDGDGIASNPIDIGSFPSPSQGHQSTSGSPRAVATMVSKRLSEGQEIDSE